MVSPPSSMDPAGLAAEGWALTGLIGPSEIAELQQLSSSLNLAPEVPFTSTTMLREGDEADRVHREVRRVLGPAARRVLVGYEPALAALVVKGSGPHAYVDYHQDWTFTDESDRRAFLIWCPLVDITPDTGTLRVAPRSHRLLTDHRGSGPFPALGGDDAYWEARTVELAPRAGQAAIYDAATVHGSGVNRSGRSRPVAMVVMTHTGTALRHSHTVDGRSADVYEVDSDYFLRRPYGARPSGYRCVDQVTIGVTG